MGVAAATAIPANGARSGTPSEPSPIRTSTLAVAGLRERLARSLGELRDSLDRDHLRRELGEHGGLVAGARADVEDALVAFESKERADRRDDERLRDRLPMPDRKGAVVVRVRTNALGNEELARDSSHRIEDALVGDPASTKLPFDHARPRLGDAAERAHFASVRSPAKRAAWRPRMRAARSGSATART